jgi:hypothetical protein
MPKSAGTMLWNLLGSYVPSDLLLLEDVQSIQINKYFGSLAVCCFNILSQYENNWTCSLHGD